MIKNWLFGPLSLAISSKGISNIFIVPSGQAVNQQIYKEECLKRRLIPFIQKYHQEDEFIFWADLASSHYAETICDFIIDQLAGMPSN